MNDATIIHCRCRRGTFSRVLAVVLPDGRLELRQDGKSAIVAGGTAALACSKCGFQREISLDSRPMAVVG